MTVYSPTRTADWLRCPVYARLRRTVEPVGDWTPNMTLGRAIGDGLVMHYRALRDGTPLPFAEVEAWAMTILEEGYPEDGSETWTLPSLQKMVSRVLAKACEDPVVAPGDTILLVDESTGGGRPDLVLRQRHGGLTITDFKFTLKLEQTYLGRTLSQYETDDQFWQYAWEAGAMFGAPVEWCRVQLMWALPRATTHLHPWRVTPDRLAFWLSGAEQWWKDMEAQELGERPEVPKWASCNGSRFGRCAFLAWCHEPETRALFYRELPPKLPSSSD